MLSFCSKRHCLDIDRTGFETEPNIVSIVSSNAFSPPVLPLKKLNVAFYTLFYIFYTLKSFARHNFWVISFSLNQSNKNANIRIVVEFVALHYTKLQVALIIRDLTQGIFISTHQKCMLLKEKHKASIKITYVLISLFLYVNIAVK